MIGAFPIASVSLADASPHVLRGPLSADPANLTRPRRAVALLRPVRVTAAPPRRP